MNSRAFVQGVQVKLDPLAPIVLPGIIKKQLMEVGATEDSLTPELAEELIKKIELALEGFLGSEGVKMIHEMMMKELRRWAPDYFDEHSLV